MIQVNSSALVYIENCSFENFKRDVRGCGTCGNISYRIEVRNSDAKNGTALLKLTNSRARGKVVKARVKNLKYVRQTDNGAKISVIGTKKLP